MYSRAKRSGKMEELELLFFSGKLDDTDGPSRRRHEVCRKGQSPGCEEGWSTILRLHFFTSLSRVGKHEFRRHYNSHSGWRVYGSGAAWAVQRIFDSPCSTSAGTGNTPSSLPAQVKRLIFSLDNQRISGKKSVQRSSHSFQYP